MASDQQHPESRSAGWEFREDEVDHYLAIGIGSVFIGIAMMGVKAPWWASAALGIGIVFIAGSLHQ
jgi:hypothetical protein